MKSILVLAGGGKRGGGSGLWSSQNKTSQELVFCFVLWHFCGFVPIRLPLRWQTLLSWEVSTYRNLEIHVFLGKRRHLIVEAKLIFPDILGRKHKVSLTFLDSTQNHLPIGGYHGVIDIERAAGLDLNLPNSN